MAPVVDVERLTRAVEALATASLGAIVPAIITAVTSWWNRDTAGRQLEAERLRQQRDDDEPPA
jgi:hypothetical protein